MFVELTIKFDRAKLSDNRSSDRELFCDWIKLLVGGGEQGQSALSVDEHIALADACKTILETETALTLITYRQYAIIASRVLRTAPPASNNEVFIQVLRILYLCQ